MPTAVTLDDAARLLVVLAVVNVGCTAVLIAAAIQHREWAALVDRAFVGAVLAFIAIGGGWIGLSHLGIWPLRREEALLIILGGMALASLPSMIWVIQLVRGRFA